MVRRVSATEAKAHFAALIEEVAHTGRKVIIERHGKPVAALVNAEEAERLPEERPKDNNPRGALALLELSGMLTNEEIDDWIRDVYEERARDPGRPVDLEG